MKIKKCQLDFDCPCADKGFICLKSAEEKREFNKKLSQVQDALEKCKFKDLKDLNCNN